MGVRGPCRLVHNRDQCVHHHLLSAKLATIGIALHSGMDQESCQVIRYEVDRSHFEGTLRDS